MTSNLKFQDYANFSFESKSTPLFEINEKDILQDKIDIATGHFSVVMPIDSQRILKINKCLEVERETGEIKLLKDKYYDNLLVVKSKNSQKDREEVIRKLNFLSKVRLESYKLLKSYLKDQVTEYYSSKVIDVPRRSIEKRLLENLKNFDFESLPITELTLVEYWERIPMESEFKKMTYQEVQNSFMEKDIKEELERFSEQGFKAFLKEKIILDIGDERGVQVRTIDNKKELLSNTDDLINLLTGDFSSYLPIPRNLGMKNGVIKLYDTYPIEYLNRKLDNKIITKLLLNIKDAQINSLKLFLNSDTGKKPEYRVVAQYLIMLKSLSVVSKEL